MTTAVYSDIRKDMAKNVLTNDVSVSVNNQAIKDSILNLLMTNKGERLYQPDIGGSLSGLLFELMSPEVTFMIRREIQEVITNWEPRAVLENVQVTPNYDDNYYAITIWFYTRYDLETQHNVSVTLNTKV